MALIKCPECGKEVSDKAPSCPQCGSPIGVVTVELTSKKWKKYKLAGVAFFIVGFFMLAVGGGAGVTWLSTIGILFAFAAIVLYVIGRLGAWWHNA